MDSYAIEQLTQSGQIACVSNAARVQAAEPSGVEQENYKPRWSGLMANRLYQRCTSSVAVATSSRSSSKSGGTYLTLVSDRYWQHYLQGTKLATNEATMHALCGEWREVARQPVLVVSLHGTRWRHTQAAKVKQNKQVVMFSKWMNNLHGWWSGDEEGWWRMLGI